MIHKAIAVALVATIVAGCAGHWSAATTRTGIEDAGITADADKTSVPSDQMPRVRYAAWTWCGKGVCEIFAASGAGHSSDLAA